ncbi:MAG: MBOAT family protein [Oceanicaulis sp.]
MFFYAFWKWDYLIILLSSIGFNYLIYLINFRTYKKWKKTFLVSSAVIVNLALLGFYKYSGFFVYDVLSLSGLNFEAPVLPLAISFFTFQQIAFVVDTADNTDERVQFDEYAAFVTFFPQLIAGPIVRHSELIPQLKAPRTKGFFLAGTAMFLIGLSKKTLIADSFSVWANAGFGNASALNFSDAWLASLSYTFQLYFDFSGYSDMAIGLGLMFGFQLPQNFNSPYKALSVEDFWRRWHMTLSRWLRDYLYIPLGGNRSGTVRTYGNLLLTMLLGGLWHGASWTFVIWGAMHGVALSISRAWARLNIPMPSILAWTITFLFVVFAWVFFRASSFADGLLIASKMLGMSDASLPQSWATMISSTLDHLGVVGVELVGTETVIPVEGWLVVAVILLVVTQCPNSHQIVEKIQSGTGWRNSVRIGCIGAIGCLAVKRLMESSAPSEFLYFQF